ncbi:right origin-binding domain protein [Klebsiella pneumoniae]|nr:right origin-binding domain protein [Klebsiella pneumoniae]AVK34705.1 right origin-binding domain protein [Klebsiella pneumoniae]AWZ77714.1 right origin-binding domain protein [Klebsiella pneumoniae]
MSLFKAVSCFFIFAMHKKLREGANKQVISSQADSLIKISRIWADFFPANTSNQPI